MRFLKRQGKLNTELKSLSAFKKKIDAGRLYQLWNFLIVPAKKKRWQRTNARLRMQISEWMRIV